MGLGDGVGKGGLWDMGCGMWECEWFEKRGCQGKVVGTNAGGV
jgi:uncharacterized protein YodC (DUF2158 family)